MKRAVRARIALAFSGVCVLALAVGLGVLASLHGRAASVSPVPGEQAIEDTPTADGSGFPDVDWEAWRAINPDVIGWISIPGTPVDYPIVQAPAADPTYYLKHDVYRKPNYMGCPYLDADCAEGGLFGSANAVVFGHNLGFGDTSMFNAVASYTDASFAREHCRVLLQTPDERREFEVQAADCIGGWEAQKRTRFESEADFSQWYADRLAESDMRLTDEAVASPIVTLCTCSYNRWADNERTVVYAAPIGAEKSASENPQVDGAL